MTETLELDGDILENESLGLSTDENADGCEGILYLTKDPSCSSRYFVTHEFGVHGVVVPLIDTLNELAAKNDRKGIVTSYVLIMNPITFFNFFFRNFHFNFQRKSIKMIQNESC